MRQRSVSPLIRRHKPVERRAFCRTPYGATILSACGALARDRQPEDKAPLLDSRAERAGQGRAPIRRDDGRAAKDAAARTPMRPEVDIP
jgi:hypothetical protein